jgi:trans-aconitate methyltransferase
MLIKNLDLSNLELDIYKTKKYANSHQTQQTMQIDGYPKPVTRSFLQAKILTEINSNHEYKRVLDIGCFDGKLLVELDRIITNADLWGFDINPHLKEFFPEKDNFHFISTDLEDLKGPIDLIILSHSILYIPDLNVLMASISRLLKDDGTLFFQIPDIYTNPFYSLMGDQSFIFTETSLSNVLYKFGYRAEVVKNDFFPRELLVTAQKDESVDLSSYKENNLFEDNIEIINCVKEELENINDQNLAVLGTTVNAAFVDEIIGKRIHFFVDENLSKPDKKFRGKNVAHPKDLNDTSHTILPYGDSGIKIQERFEKLYKGTFSVV